MWYEIFLYVLSIPLSSHVWTRVFFISILGLVFFLPYTTFIECFLDQLCALIYAFVRASLAIVFQNVLCRLSCHYLSPIEVN